MPTLRRIWAALDHLISCNDTVQRHMVTVVTNQMFYWFFGGKLGGGWGSGALCLFYQRYDGRFRNALESQCPGLTTRNVLYYIGEMSVIL